MLDAGCWILDSRGGIEGLKDMELADRVALVAACKVVAVMLTMRAHASSLFTPLTPTRSTYYSLNSH